jgi:hypothetical protein
MTLNLLRDNYDTTIMRAPRRWASHPDCRCLPILIAALQSDWLRRIEYLGLKSLTLETLQMLVEAHASAIA